MFRARVLQHRGERGADVSNAHAVQGLDGVGTLAVVVGSGSFGQERDELRRLVRFHDLDGVGRGRGRPVSRTTRSMSSSAETPVVSPSTLTALLRTFGCA